jgi:hypothetical protein
MPGPRNDLQADWEALLRQSFAEFLPDSPRYQPRPLPPADWTGEIIRPDDLLYLSVSAYNLRPIDHPAGPRLGRINEQSPALLVFELPPQTIAEQAFFEPSSTKPQVSAGTDLTTDAGRPKDELAAGDAAKARFATMCRRWCSASPACWSGTRSSPCCRRSRLSHANRRPPSSRPHLTSPSPSRWKPPSSCPIGSFSRQTLTRAGSTARRRSRAAAAPSSGTRVSALRAPTTSSWKPRQRARFRSAPSGHPTTTPAGAGQERRRPGPRDGGYEPERSSSDRHASRLSANSVRIESVCAWRPTKLVS